MGGIVGVTAQWWPTNGLPKRLLNSLDLLDKVASIASMGLTAAGVVLAYLVWRSPSSGPYVERDREHEPVRPAQLPRDDARFTGRETEVKRLLALVSDPPRVSAVVISAIDGMAGVGKTALALHAGHQLAERYPDGQLFIDLHGFTQGVAPVASSDALDRMLRALGVAGDRIPVE